MGKSFRGEGGIPWMSFRGAGGRWQTDVSLVILKKNPLITSSSIVA